MRQAHPPLTRLPPLPCPCIAVDGCSRIRLRKASSFPGRNNHLRGWLFHVAVSIRFLLLRGDATMRPMDVSGKGLVLLCPVIVNADSLNQVCPYFCIFTYCKKMDRKMMCIGAEGRAAVVAMKAIDSQTGTPVPWKSATKGPGMDHPASIKPGMHASQDRKQESLSLRVAALFQ